MCKKTRKAKEQLEATALVERFPGSKRVGGFFVLEPGGLMEKDLQLGTAPLSLSARYLDSSETRPMKPLLYLRRLPLRG